MCRYLLDHISQCGDFFGSGWDGALDNQLVRIIASEVVMGL